eukprot:TRINITY_DN11944_c0_g1_i1.p1 TRINITY_DN11944_c0_g1~~TRINITY_DN11944_c0_g1_i1.p1  ORF type:complete len:526 (-),score=166.79 TRINITY_DN11944_c0_g1_i1:92-1669(-)
MRVMEFLTKKLGNQYPDIAMISDLYQELVEKHHKASDDGLAGDAKYRPLPLLIAVLYKLQARNEDFFKTGGQALPHKMFLLELVGYYWHVQHDAGKLLREGINGVTGREQVEELIKRNRGKICQSLGLCENDVPYVSVSELMEDDISPDGDRRLEDHCPDFVISIHHCHKAVVFTVLGTRIFPRPHPHDIIMDLAAKTEPFHHGLAHSGMVAGSRNLIKHALPKLSSELSKYPGYSLLIVGYSLGAGLAHLFMMDLELGGAKQSFPPGTKIRAITYGNPPVFTAPSGNVSTLDNILMISNHNDGITGASLKCINDIFLKTKAIHKLNLQRRTLLKMAFSKNSSSANDADLVAEALEEMELPEDKEKAVVPSGLFSKTRAKVSNLGSSLVKGVTLDVWDQVEAAVESIPQTEHAELTQVGRNLIVMRKDKDKDDISLTKFSGSENIRKFSHQIRFKYGMFEDHMPWGYGSLFTKLGTTEAVMNIDLAVLDIDKEDTEDTAKTTEEEQQVAKALNSGLYPDLTSMME